MRGWGGVASVGSACTYTGGMACGLAEPPVTGKGWSKKGKGKVGRENVSTTIRPIGKTGTLSTHT